LEVAQGSDAEKLSSLLASNASDKVPQMLELYRSCKVDEWARSLKNQYLGKAFLNLEEIAVTSTRKEPLKNLADFLVQRDH
jgi:geranylgeranyl diphosphate synthase type II